MESPHALKTWIDKNTTQAAFARAVDLSESHLSDILKGKKTPSLDLAERMSIATGRAVTLSDFVQREAAE